MKLEEIKVKKLLDYCTQERRYGDSYGKCVIQLEPEDDADAIIKDFTRTRELCEKTYSSPKRVNHYEDKTWYGQVKVFDGDLIVFDTYQVYLD